MVELSVVVPCYNEAANLPRLIGRFREVLHDAPGIELVLVDNGSTDGSADVFRAELAKPENAFARIVTVPVNQGYGFGIVSGLRTARGRFLGWTHADLQTDPADIVRGFSELLGQADADRCILRGCRVGRNWFDAAFTGGMTLLASSALGVWLSDINAQPKIFPRAFFESLDDLPNDFSLDLYLLYRAKMANLRELRLPVHFGKRLAGEAKGGASLSGKVRLTKRTVAYIFELKRRLKRTPESSVRKAA